LDEFSWPTPFGLGAMLYHPLGASGYRLHAGIECEFFLSIRYSQKTIGLEVNKWANMSSQFVITSVVKRPKVQGQKMTITTVKAFVALRKLIVIIIRYKGS
jgi:hypothetical protein